MSSRVGLRFFQNSRAAFRNAQYRFGAGRRFQTSDAAAAEPQSVFQRLWNSPVGVKTVHFWLAAVNFFLGCVGIVQVGRIYNYHRSLEQSPAEAVKSMEHEVIDSAKEAVAKSEAAVEKSA
ncbi:unnamed protein product [Aspergillus oryzae]|uniref:Unnamed protein product n=1 Tax=Aspergillus oryzae var. brunneus TaxID=332754 RepID=A0ABQ6KK15_ASPOZ|nr:unnamed protein product [Aspergillus oryzae]GMG44928.1 unnamed protein product [Aspergillus oryzae var. brunneus]